MDVSKKSAADAKEKSVSTQTNITGRHPEVPLSQILEEWRQTRRELAEIRVSRQRPRHRMVWVLASNGPPQ